MALMKQRWPNVESPKGVSSTNYGPSDSEDTTPRYAKSPLKLGALYILIAFTIGGSDGRRIRLFHLEWRTHPWGD
jgi:hypothetical protein